MKLLPTGRKSVLYLTLYGSVLGAGSVLLHHFSMMVNSIVVSFGLSEDMHNPVSVFVLLGIILAGAALGCWIVRKFVILEDGSVDVGIAQFVKWSMRVIAATFIFQSTLDTPLAMEALASCLVNCYLITSFEWSSLCATISQQSGGRATSKNNRAEFLSRSGKVAPRGTMKKSSRSSYAWCDSPVEAVAGLISPPSGGVTRNQPDYYSTFHDTPNRMKFTKEEWESFTQESTRQAVAELASSPEFTKWVIQHADRIQLQPADDSSDEITGRGSNSTGVNAVESGD